MPKIFVYGTLMRGKGNHHLMRNSTFIGDATLDGYSCVLIQSGNWYPGIVKDDEAFVKGELWQVPDSDTPHFDRLESNGYLYQRTPTKVKCIGEIHDAEAYVYLHQYIRKVKGEDTPWDESL